MRVRALNGISPGSARATAQGTPQIGSTAAAAKACASAPIHHWRFDAASGNTVTDAGTAGDNGTIVGASRIAQGRLGGALRFDGDGDWVQIGADPLPATGCGWTTGLWVNSTAANAWTTLFAPATRNGWQLRLAQDAKVGIANVGTADYTFEHTVTVRSWEYLTFVGNGTNTALYVNGSLIGTINQMFALPLDRFGATDQGSTSSINATVDDVRVYARAMTATQVTALYNVVNTS